MKLVVTATLVGYALWSVVWLTGGALLRQVFPAEVDAFAAGGSLRAPAPLLASLTLSVACSLAAGVAAGRLGRERARTAVAALATCLVLTGLAVQASAWQRMPLLYHLAFLLLLAPACLLGWRLDRRRAGRGS